jgi:hypothetical protein
MRADRGVQFSWRNLDLGDFFTEGEFAEVLMNARWRVIRQFADARFEQGRRATKGYVVGLDDQLSSLALYLQQRMSERAQSKIYAARDLPDGHQYEPRRQQETLVRHVRFEIFMRLLVLMRDTHILWYVNGEWSLPQSVVDEYLLMFQGGKQGFHNDRSFHGRPNRDRRLSIAPGVSVAS